MITIIGLAVVDTVIPIPITALALIHVFYQRPAWFSAWVDAVYRP